MNAPWKTVAICALAASWTGLSQIPEPNEASGSIAAKKNAPAPLVDKASLLIGMEVRNPQGEKLGTIQDLGFVPESGQIVYAAVASGGVLGVGQKIIPVPLSAFSKNPGNDFLLLAVEKKKFEAAPALESNSPATTFIGPWGASTHKIDHSAALNSAAAERTEEPKPGASVGMRSVDPNKSLVPRMRRASNLIGMEVRNEKSEKLGEIKDIVIELESGRAAYAILSVGGFLGIGEKLIAVPTMVLTQTDRGELLLHADREKLLGAPSFDTNHWPDLSNPAWGAKVYRYHGAGAYWEQMGLEPSTPETSQSPRLEPSALANRLRAELRADSRFSSVTNLAITLDKQKQKLIVRGQVPSMALKEALTRKLDELIGRGEYGNEIAVGGK